MIKISVIVTSYNHEKYIRACLESIIMQKINYDLEIILGDDASTDQTMSIMLEYKKQYGNLFVDFQAEKNLGITKNLERCLKRASGTYIAICEGDDYWLDEYKLQKQVDFLEKHHDYSMCFNALVLYEESQKKFSLHTSQMNLAQQDFIIKDLIKENFIGNFSCCMYRTEIIKRIPDKIFNIYTVDWMFNMICAEYGKIGFIKQLMSVYRIHQSGSWSAQSYLAKKAQLIKCVNNYDAFFDHQYTTEFKNSLVLSYYQIPQPSFTDKKIKRFFIKCKNWLRKLI